MTMPMNLKDYLKIYNNEFDLDFCKNTVKKIKKNNWIKHTFYDYISDKTIQYGNELDISYDDSEENKIIQEKLWFLIKRYIEDNSFVASWYNAWSGYTKVRFNKYDKHTEMHLHCDHIHSMFDGQRKGIPTLSIVGCLNDNYTGGDFIMWESEKIEIPAGSVIIFPSNFLYPHKVTPVTKGTRYSFVSWVW